jgi:hypothetical protein
MNPLAETLVQKRHFPALLRVFSTAYIFSLGTY